MQVLRKGDSGENVERWQLFLIGQRLDPGAADGDFGPRTHAATMEFQDRNSLLADGVVGRGTLARAVLLGFPGFTEGGNFPARPDFGPLVSTADRQRHFGAFEFVPDPKPGNPENIRILPDWEENNLERFALPELDGIRGASRSNSLFFHKKAGKQLQALWAEWREAGLLGRVLVFDGAFNARFIRGSRSVLSNHAFGTAFDINAEFNALGHVPAPRGERGCLFDLVPIAHKHGFFWGGHFSRQDGMHFEIARLT